MQKEKTNGRTLAGKRAASSDTKRLGERIGRRNSEEWFCRILGYKDKDGTTTLVRSISKAHRQLQEVGKTFGNRARFFRTQKDDIDCVYAKGQGIKQYFIIAYV